MNKIILIVIGILCALTIAACNKSPKESNTNDAQVWYEKGLELVKQEKYKESLPAFDEALKIAPKHIQAWYQKAIALNQTGQYIDAVKACDKVIELDPKHVDAWLWKGPNLEILGKIDEAIKCYDKAIEIDPNKVMAWIMRGSDLIVLKKYAEALKSYDKALEYQYQPKTLMIVSYEKARCYALMNDKQNALKHLNEAIKLRPAYKQSAKVNEDFKILWDDDEFKKLIE